MRLSGVEVFFLVIAVVIVAGILLSAANSAKEFGPRLQGTVQQCINSYKGGAPRQCVVRFSDSTTKWVDVPLGRGSTGDSIVVVRMKHVLSGSTYYTVASAGVP